MQRRATIDLEDLLERGLNELQLALPRTTQQRLLAFLTLLERWGRVYNLTAIRDPAQAVVHHLLDALSVLPILMQRFDLTRERVADVGSGAGIPGLVLAIAEPLMQLHSIESVGKKAAFQRQVCAELGLSRVVVHAARVESIRQPCRLVLTRAFATLSETLKSTSELLVPQGTLVAMKGQHQDTADEISQLRERYDVETIPLTVPGLEAERHLVLVGPRVF
jgi:16S rRNA (guanine527-N7)-methyltransferase